MSFISKRERVFNEYELLDLPPRNENKLKTYASCTDARAWSHFGSDKSEHLVEIIKRNNETCTHKYLPTKVIVDTLMSNKNTEIARLKRKVEEFEQMLAVYDQLELEPEQKLEIAKAHESIKEANKDLEDMYLDLDMSGYTEGIDSEAFETGKSKDMETGKSRFSMSEKSRGDECSLDKIYILRQAMETKSVQIEVCDKNLCNIGTMATDPRIDDMQEAIICKDAKLTAMRNTIAMLENDVCEPYCIYAHIYTALEKIFGILCQNEKYKKYLSLLTIGKDIRPIDIKGKILFKMKVLEKFCLALIAPCSQNDENGNSCDCNCNTIQVSRVETTFALPTSGCSSVPLDNKRAQLVADIMQSDEIKELLDRKNETNKTDSDFTVDCYCSENYSIDIENVNRLKNLQASYDELIICYENMKHEKEKLQEKYAQYDDIEAELEELRGQLREYTALWNEKEFYKNRSEDLDELKEKYLLLSEETSNLETQYKAEIEINNCRLKKIEDLRNANINLENRLNDVSIAFEKEKNTLQCKLKEADCHCMCQEQQIKSLSSQIDRLLEQHDKTPQDLPNSIMLINEIEAQKEQINNLKDLLFCSDEERKDLHDKFQEHLDVINNLKNEIEDWKANYEKAMQRNAYLEKYANQYKDQIEKISDENEQLAKDVDAKTRAIENLINVVDNKSFENNKLIDEIELKKRENNELLEKLYDLSNQNENVTHDKNQALESLNLEMKNSQELLHKIKNYDEHMQRQSESLQKQMQSYDDLQARLQEAIEKNKHLEIELNNREKNNSMLLREINRLQMANMSAANDINNLQSDKDHLEKSCELVRKQSEVLQEKLSDIGLEQNKLKESLQKVSDEKLKLEKELQKKSTELEKAINSATVSRKKSNELLVMRENLEEDLSRSSEAYKKLVNERILLQKQIASKDGELKLLLEALDRLRNQNADKTSKAENEIYNLKKAYDELLADKNMLQNDLDNKKEEINHLYNTLESKTKENRELSLKIRELKEEHLSAKNSIEALENDKTERDELRNKIKYYESLESDYDELKGTHDQIAKDKESLEAKLKAQLNIIKIMEKEKQELNKQAEQIMNENESLEQALLAARNELSAQGEETGSSYKMIMAEIESLKKEKLDQKNKIRDLLDRLDQSDNLITILNEDLSARDDKIAILQNHINALEEEIKELHTQIEHSLCTGEQIRATSLEKIDHTLNKMEAHHSKATHNMKLEIAKLNEHRNTLENRLSNSKLNTEEANKEKFKLELKIAQLYNERELIATEIKQLEISTVGDSSLSARNCEFDAIIKSLNQIARAFDGVALKKSDLENTLLKVQTSSHIVLNKADEAKKIAEKEKQKIINEKEEAIKERLKLEKKMEDMKEKLEKETARDKNVIRDLEAEILNQNLLMNKINQASQDYVAKLNDELHSLQNRYKDALDKNSELEEKLQKSLEENKEKINAIHKINKVLERQNHEISKLQQELTALKNIHKKDVAVQANFTNPKRSMATEISPEITSNHPNNKLLNDVYNEKRIKETSYKNNTNTPAPNQSLNYVHEVTVHRTNVDPPFDLVRSSYQNFKAKKLSTGPLEQHSFSSPVELENSKLQTTSKPYQTHSKKVKQSDKNYDDIPNSEQMNLDVCGFNKQESNFESSSEHPHQNSTKSVEKHGTQTENIDHNTTRNKLSEKGKYSKSSKQLKSKEITIKFDEDYINHKKESENNAPMNPDEVYESPFNKEQNIKPYDLEVKLKDQNNPRYLRHMDSIKIKQKERFDDQINKNLKKSTPKESKLQEAFESKDDPQFEQKRMIDDSEMLVIYKDSENIKTDQRNSSNPWSSTTNAIVENVSVSQNKVKKSLTPSGNTSSKKTLHSPGIKNVLLTDQNRVPTKHSTNTDYLSVSPNSSITNSKGYFSVEALQGDLSADQDNGKQDLASDFTFTVDSKSEPKMKTKYYTALDKSYPKMQPIKAESETNLKNHQIKPNASHSSPEIASSEQTDSEDLKSENKKDNNKPSDNENRILSTADKEVLVKTENSLEYEKKIQILTKALENMEKDCKKKLEAIKLQYDANVKSIINEHNQGVQSIQNLHEESLQDIIKIHENEIESLRTMSVEAMRKVEKLKKENEILKIKVKDCSCPSYVDHKSYPKADQKKRKPHIHTTKVLTKTNIEAFNVKPKTPRPGPCTCSVDASVNETIKTIFQQVDMEQRKLAEIAYTKYIANKILSGQIDKLDSQELSFLHYKVCRSWKQKLTKEDAIQKRIETLESELINKQRNAQQHIAELDRRVAEEKRRLEEAREAVCRTIPGVSRKILCYDADLSLLTPPPPPGSTAERDFSCSCHDLNMDATERGSAGDLLMNTIVKSCPKRLKSESNRAVLVKIDSLERQERRLLDETPTRLRRDRIGARNKK